MGDQRHIEKLGRLRRMPNGCLRWETLCGLVADYCGRPYDSFWICDDHGDRVPPSKDDSHSFRMLHPDRASWTTCPKCRHAHLYGLPDPGAYVLNEEEFNAVQQWA